MLKSYEDMSENPQDTGLCDYCRVTMSRPGGSMCEGECCSEAYDRYVDEEGDNE